MRHEAKAEEKQFLSEWLRDMTSGTVWNTVVLGPFYWQLQI